MKVKVKFTIIAVLLAAFVMAFAGEAMAIKNPKWVKWSWSGSLVRNPDAKVPITSGSYYLVKIEITHTNNSDEQDIIAIYDKELKFSATINTNLRWGTPKLNTKVSSTIKSSKVNDVNVWPGRAQTLTYYIPLGNLIKAQNADRWKWQNEDIGAFKNKYNMFKDRSVNYSYNVRARKSR